MADSELVLEALRIVLHVIRATASSLEQMRIPGTEQRQLLLTARNDRSAANWARVGAHQMELMLMYLSGTARSDQEQRVQSLLDEWRARHRVALRSELRFHREVGVLPFDMRVQLLEPIWPDPSWSPIELWTALQSVVNTARLLEEVLATDTE